jgi:hypothetical protein
MIETGMDIARPGERWTLGGVLYEAHPAPEGTDDELDTEDAASRLWLYRPGCMTPSWKLRVEEALDYIAKGGLRPLQTIPNNLSCWSDAEQAYYRDGKVTPALKV